jgi:hypothetical protein
MKRSTPLKRTGFKPKGWPFELRPVKTIEYTPRPRAAAVAISDGKARMVVPVPKRQYVRDKDYLRWVASLPCAHCGIEGRSQAAHSDDNGAAGKGMGIKACDSTAYPACAPTPGDQGCHARIGSSGLWPKETRRAMERDYAQRTRAKWEAEQALRKCSLENLPVRK